MKNSFKSLISVLLVLMGITLLNGCNTVKGFGKDMQAGGSEIQKAANNASQ